MGGFAVKRYGFEGCVNPHHYLSLLSPLDFTVYENLDLPFDINEPVYFASCGELLYFHGTKGSSAICNLTTKQMKVLPPPTFKPPPHWGVSIAGCLGYDSTSGDYKVVRNIYQYLESEPDEEDGEQRYLGCESRFELYSFKSGSWREIPTPVNGGAAINDCVGVYVARTGSCYWIATVDIGFGGLPDDPFHGHALSFDFATESFGHFPLPYPSTFKRGDMGNHTYKLVECRGSLGALVYWRPDGYGSASPLSVELFARRETSWDLLYSISLAHVEGAMDVERPLGLRDDRLLIFETKHSTQIAQLMVYDLQTGMLKKLGIYDNRETMCVDSYVESANPVQLPDSMPITMIPHVESTDPLPITSSSSEDDEEKKTRKNRPMMRRGSKSKRKRKTTRTVSKNKQHS